MQCLEHLASLLWDSVTVPEDWLGHLSVPLHKQEPIQDRDNYRGIPLLSVPSKVTAGSSRGGSQRELRICSRKVSVVSARVKGVYTGPLHSECW